MSPATTEEAIRALNSLKIELYDEPNHPSFVLSKVGEYLLERTRAQVQQRPGLLHAPSTLTVEKYATRLAIARVSSPYEERPNVPTEMEISYETGQLLTGKVFGGIIYDGFAVQNLFLDLLPTEKRRLEYLHIVFTDRLLATFSDGDRRYHLRTIICGCPCIISLAGLVEAPARAPAFYLAMRGLATIGLQADPVVEDDHLTYGDPRVTEVAKGYAMQCVFHWVFGDPFCTDPQCRLYNAHTQRQMLTAQLGAPEYCERHSAMLEPAADENRPRKEARYIGVDH